MLTIKCSGCKTKFFRYLKIGQGKVLRCHKERIKKVFNAPAIDDEGNVTCPKCGQLFAKDTPTYYDMIRDGFTYSGYKIRK